MKMPTAWWRLIPETEEEKAWWNSQKRLYWQKQDARMKTTRFVKLTGVAKPPCVCGVERVQMHHVDYAVWNLIAFLCAKCHHAEHRGKLNTPFETHDLRWLAVADTVAFA